MLWLRILITISVDKIKRIAMHYGILLTPPLGIDLIHDGRHVGFAIIMQISYTLLRGQTAQMIFVK